MPVYRVCKDEGNQITIPADTKVYATVEAAWTCALKKVLPVGALYECSLPVTYRWHGTLRTNKDAVFTKVNT